MGYYKGAVMDNRTQLLDAIQQPDFWIFTSLFAAGTVTLALKKRNEPIDIYVFIGELILAAGAGALMWFAGLYSGMDSMQIALVALPSAYGQVHLVTKLINIKKGVNNGSKTQ